MQHQCTCVFPACFRNKGQQQTVTLLASKHLLHYKLAASTIVASCSARKKAMHPEACTAYCARALCACGRLKGALNRDQDWGGALEEQTRKNSARALRKEVVHGKTCPHTAVAPCRLHVAPAFSLCLPCTGAESGSGLLLVNKR